MYNCVLYRMLIIFDAHKNTNVHFFYGSYIIIVPRVVYTLVQLFKHRRRAPRSASIETTTFKHINRG